MTVKEEIEAKIASLQAELAALPTEVHTLETEVWAKIKAFFHPDPPVAPSA